MVIESFQDLHETFTQYRRDAQWFFRGQADTSWAVLPKSGRSPYNEGNDLNYLQAWWRKGAEFVDRPISNIWELMAIAQHHGLPTRLSDWSYNPLVAAYFSCATHPDRNGAIYCLRPAYMINPDRAIPNKISKVARYKPTTVASRIGRQSGLFTAHPEPSISLPEALSDNDRFQIHTVDKAYKRELLFELNHYGINQMSLMDDLDGLSAHMRWTQENGAYWTNSDETLVQFLTENEPLTEEAKDK